MRLFLVLLFAFATRWAAYAEEPHSSWGPMEQEPVFVGKESWMSDHEWLTLFDPPFTQPTEIPVDSGLRRVLFDQLRAKVRNNGTVRFRRELRAFKNWALFRGEALDAQDKPIYVSYSPEVKVKDDPLANDNLAGLWLRSRAGWRLIAYLGIGSGELNDPTTQYWADRYGMPLEFWGKYAEPVVQKQTAFAFPKRTEISSESGLRKVLFDILRPEVERSYGKGMRFEGSLEGFKSWALFQGNTLDAKGRNVPEDGGDTVALWLHTYNGWLLVDFNVGHTDVFYMIWKEKYGAPFF